MDDLNGGVKNSERSLLGCGGKKKYRLKEIRWEDKRSYFSLPLFCQIVHKFRLSI